MCANAVRRLLEDPLEKSEDTVDVGDSHEVEGIP